MPYVVLARKWRPQRFDEVVGQRHVTSTLKNAIKAGRLANAYLFAGPRGVGKTTVARILAKAINCDSGPTPEPCNQCTPCVEITEGRSLDVLEIDGASNRGVDEVRDLRENIRYAASPGKSKIYIIDEVHMLTKEAFNALLKTLEEPPAGVLFIFATTEPQKVPATILSRCQRFDFHRLPADVIEDQLRRICQAEGISAEDEALRMIAVKADGSMRDAESLLDQVVSFAEGQVTRETVAELVGLIDRDFFLRLGRAVLEGDVRAAVELAQQVHLRGYDFGEFLQSCGEYFRDLLLLRAADEALLDVPESYLPQYREQAESFSDEDLLRLVKIVSDGAYRIRFTPNPRVRFELTLVRMAKLRKSADIVELLRSVEGALGPSGKNGGAASSVPSAPSAAALKYRPSGGGMSKAARAAGAGTGKPKVAAARPATYARAMVEQTTVAAPAAPVSAGAGEEEETVPQVAEISLQEVKDRWEEAVTVVRKKRVALGVFLAEAYPKGLSGNVLELAFGPDHTFQMDSVCRHREEIASILRKSLGWNVSLKCVKDENGSPRSENTTPLARLQALEQLAEKNPVIRKILDDFDAELIL